LGHLSVSGACKLLAATQPHCTAGVKTTLSDNGFITGVFMIIALLVGIVLFAFILTAAVRRYALHKQLMDVPNERSSHTVPTPRGGGIAIVASCLLALPVFWLTDMIPGFAVAGLFLGGVLVACVGFLDDQGHVPARWRMLVHMAAALLLVSLAGSLPPVPVFGLYVTFGLVNSLLAAMFIVWHLNLFNFMDGIDGIAGTEAVTVCAAAAFLLWFTGELEWALVVAVFGAASLGFLVWNWPPAKIFMGDAGSGFLGFSLAGLAVLTHAEAGLTLWAWLILLGVFIVDATVTLIHRVIRSERWYDAHRNHAYQHAARETGGHLPVTLVTGLINLTWLLPLAWVTVLNPGWGPGIVLVAWLPLFLLALRFRAGQPG